MDAFTDISPHIARRLAFGERILLILLDAFGHALLDSHRSHPLVRRLEITPLNSQFPSTTTAHITSLHFGVPVTEHGLYEWSVYEPSLDRIIQPLPYRLAGDETRDGLAGTLDPDVLIDLATWYEGQEVTSSVILPTGLVDSAFSRRACRGARLSGSDDLAASVRTLTTQLASGEIGFGYIYWPDIDTAAHRFGPGSAEVSLIIGRALAAIEAGLATAPSDVTVLLTADHGQTSVDPQRMLLLDRLWPELTGQLTQPRPAGSSRDVFLHVRPDAVAPVIDALANRLEGRAEVHRAADLFPSIGPRLAARLGDVAVLAADGTGAWLSTAPTSAQSHLGSHGGRTEAETATYLAELRT